LQGHKIRRSNDKKPQSPKQINKPQNSTKQNDGVTGRTRPIINTTEKKNTALLKQRNPYIGLCLSCARIALFKVREYLSCHRKTKERTFRSKPHDLRRRFTIQETRLIVISGN